MSAPTTTRKAMKLRTETHASNQFLIRELRVRLSLAILICERFSKCRATGPPALQAAGASLKTWLTTTRPTQNSSTPPVPIAV